MLDKNNFQKNFAINIERERILLGLTQSQMASKLDLSISSYKRMLTQETTKIDSYTVYLACKLTNKFAFELWNESDKRSETIRKLEHLSTRQINFINSIIDFETSFNDNLLYKDKNSSKINNYISVIIPTGNMYDGMIYDTSNIEKMDISNYIEKFGNTIHFGIKITSNHLHPAYNLDDILLISSNPIRDGDTGIFLNKETNTAYIRKFHQTNPCMLEPVNNFGETFYVDSNDKPSMDKWIKLGYIVTKIRN